jgi:hypothetical protein
MHMNYAPVHRHCLKLQCNTHTISHTRDTYYHEGKYFGYCNLFGPLITIFTWSNIHLEAVMKMFVDQYKKSALLCDVEINAKCQSIWSFGYSLHSHFFSVDSTEFLKSMKQCVT